MKIIRLGLATVALGLALNFRGIENKVYADFDGSWFISPANSASPLSPANPASPLNPLNKQTQIKQEHNYFGLEEYFLYGTLGIIGAVSLLGIYNMIRKEL